MSEESNKKSTLVPRLRFPEFQGPWALSSMSDLYSFKGNNSLSRDKLNYIGGSLRNIHYGDIHTKFALHFHAEAEPVPYINDGESNSTIRPENQCKAGDMVFADASEDMADIGKAIEIIDTGDVPLVAGLHTILARPNEGSFAVGFGAYLFSSAGVRKQIQREAQGAKVLGLSANRMGNVQLHYPSNAAEQQKIADCLSSLDELITAETQMLNALKTHKKGLMQQLFPREGETVPRLRFPEFREAGEWTEKKFGQLCHFVRGPFGGALKKDIFVSDGLAVYEQSHAIYGDFGSFRYFITEEKYKELKRFSVRPGDIIMSCSGTMGKFAIIPEGAKTGVINQALLKLTVKDGFHHGFVKFVLDLPSNQEKLLSQAAGGAIKNVVGVGEMKEIELRVPNIKEQQKIANCLSSLDDLITTQSQKIEALKTHKKGLMQQLFPVLDEVQA